MTYKQNISNDDYHSINDHVSNTGLKMMSRSPAHYKAFMSERKKDTASLRLGKALHCAVFEPEIYTESYIFLDDVENRVCTEYKQAKKEYGDGMLLIKSEIEKISAISVSISNNQVAREYLESKGQCELSGFAIDPITGVKTKHRFDKLLDCGIGVDLKSTIDARPDPFSRAIMNYGYHHQAAFYSDQYEWITGEKLRQFVFIAVESSAPYAVKVYMLDAESIKIGRDEYRKNLNLYAQCLDRNEWPSYDCNQVELIGLPEWAMFKHDEEMINEMELDNE